MTVCAPFAAQGSNVVALHSIDAPLPGRVVIVVPCYNEAARLDRAAFSAYLSENPSVRLVFVNDGSKDATLEVLHSLCAAHPDRIEVLSLSRNAGKAEAVRRGLGYAAASGAAFVGYWDADLATPLEAITDFLRIGHRFADTDVIYGARLPLLGHRVTRTLSRRIISRLCARLARIAVGLPIGDTQCGAKLLRNTPRLRAALERPFSAGWLFDVELFSRLARGPSASHAAFYEYPLPEWTEVPGSKVTGRAIRRAGLAMLRLIAERRLGLPPRAVAGDLPDVVVSYAPDAAVNQAA